MCSVLAGLTALMSVASGAAQYQAQQQQARAQEASLRAQADNARNQAIMAQHNADMEAKKQEILADNYAREGQELRDRRRLVEGQQRAQAGAAGIGFSGSALDILASGNEAYAQDQLTLANNQRLKNWELRVNQTNYLNDKASSLVAAENYDKDASYVRSQADQAGLATILGTAVSVAGGLAGSIGGGGGSAAATSSRATNFGNVSSDIGHGITATYSPSTATHSFTSASQWANTPKTYFSSISNNKAYKTGNWF